MVELTLLSRPNSTNFKTSTLPHPWRNDFTQKPIPHLCPLQTMTSQETWRTTSLPLHNKGITWLEHRSCKSGFELWCRPFRPNLLKRFQFIMNVHREKCSNEKKSTCFLSLVSDESRHISVFTPSTGGWMRRLLKICVLWKLLGFGLQFFQRELSYFSYLR